MMLRLVEVEGGTNRLVRSLKGIRGAWRGELGLSLCCILNVLCQLRVQFLSVYVEGIVRKEEIDA